MAGAVALGEGVFISTPVAAAFAPVLSRALTDARRQGQLVDPAVVDAVELLVVVARHHRNRAALPLDVPHGMPQRTPGEMLDGVNTTTAAQHLGITERAVRARLERGTLAGERTSTGAWVVFLDPEGTTE